MVRRVHSIFLEFLGVSDDLSDEIIDHLDGIG
jgi:hypothetical protein